jgi:hypothetical protein
LEQKVVAIHQPNFLPWLGFFNKWAKSDVFILLDDVQFPKTGGGVWTNRCGVLKNGESSWVTVPIKRNFHGKKLINEVEIIDDISWKIDIKNKVINYYKGAPFFDEIVALLEECLKKETIKLCDFNFQILKIVGHKLNLDSNKIVFSSNLKSFGDKTDRLCSLVGAVNGTKYLSGDGSRGYQDDQVFFKKHIEVEYQNFRQKPYNQMRGQEFVSGLSVLDSLMNIGIDKVKSDYLL